MDTTNEAPEEIAAQTTEPIVAESSPYQLPPDDVAAIDELGNIYQPPFPRPPALTERCFNGCPPKANS